MNQWLDAITQLRREKVAPVPKGFLTRDEVMKELGCSTGHINRVLKEMLAGGIVEKKMFRRMLSDGRTLNLPHYRMKK